MNASPGIARPHLLDALFAREMTPAIAFKQAGFNVMTNSVLAVVLTLFFDSGNFWTTWLYANVIGLTMWAMIATSFTMFRRAGIVLTGWRITSIIAVIMPIGLTIGWNLGNLLLGRPIEWPMWLAGGAGLGFLILLSLVFFFLWWALANAYRVRTEATLHARAIEIEQRRATEAQLKLLQAQIEPHFLFNTLALLDSMIATEPAHARELLGHINDYLRAALSATRAANGTGYAHTLGKELDLVTAYLEIMRMRCCSRLSYSIEADDAARASAFPTMLLQPLVENAVRHGVEPAKDGGRIEIRAQCTDHALELVVADTGIGLHDDAPTRGAGTGIANVAERLRALFGEHAALTLEENRPSGVVVRLRIPEQQVR